MKKTLSRAIARSTALMLSFMLMFGTVRTPVFAAQDEAADAQVELFLDENAGDSFTDEGAAEKAAGQQIDIIDENGEIVGDADQPVEDAFDEAGTQAEAEAEAPAEVPAEEEVEAGLDVASQEEPPAEVPAEEEAEAGQDGASQEEAAASSQEEAPAQVPAEEEAEAGQDVASQEEEAASQEEPPAQVPAEEEAEAGQDGASQEEAAASSQEEAPAEVPAEEEAEAGQDGASQEEEVADDHQFAEQDTSDGDTAQSAVPGSGETNNDAAGNDEACFSGSEVSDTDPIIEDDTEESVAEGAANAYVSVNSDTYLTLNVGQTENIYFSSPSGESITRAAPNISDPQSVSVVGSGSSWRITALKQPSFSGYITVSFTVYADVVKYVGGTPYRYTVTHNPRFLVTINGGGNGSSGGSSGGNTNDSYTISCSRTTLNLDHASNSCGQLVFTCGTYFSNNVYLEYLYTKGNIVKAYLNYTDGNKAYYNIEACGSGTEYLTFRLIQKQSDGRLWVKDSVNVTVYVSCNHIYDKGVITKEATRTEAGKKTYTCKYCGYQKTETIPATAASISGCDISLSSESYTYTGSAHKPSVTVKLGSKTLSSGTDYTVSYTNNTNAGTAKVTVTGKGNYSGSASKNFTIQKAAQSLNATVSATSLKKGATTQITASGIGTITYTSSDTSVAAVSSTGLITAKAAGKASITVTAAGNANYNSAKKTISITVTETKPAAVTTPVSISFSETSVTLDKGRSRVITATTYGDLPSTFNFSCVRSDTSVMSVAWTGSWKQSNGKYSHDLTITGLADGKAVITVYVKDVNTGKYVVGKSINITVKSPVSPAPAANKITDSGVTLSKTSYTYNGKAKKPGVTVKVGGKKLINGTDYKLSYSSNIKAGTAVVTVTGKGKYTGKVQKTFTINKASQNFNLIRSSYTYKKSDLKKSKQRVPIIVFNYKGTLSKRSSSKYIYFSNGACYVKKGTPKGTYRVIVSASGNKNYKMQEKTVKITIK